MNQANEIRLDLPNDAKTAPLIGVCLGAMLDRLHPMPDQAGLVSAATRAIEEALAQPSLAKQIWLHVVLDLSPVALTVEMAGWQHTLPLPSSPAHLDQNTQPAPPQPHGSIPAEVPIDKASGLGMGLFLVKKVMDEVRYTPLAGDNRWHLVKKLTIAPSSRSKKTATPDLPRSIRLDMPVSYQHQNVLGACIEQVVRTIEGLEQVDDIAYQTQLAAQEVSTNIIDHAYDGEAGRILMEITFDPIGQRLVIDSRDQGRNTFVLTDIPDPFFPGQTASGGFLSGSLLLLISMTIVNGGNYLFNLVLGRWLGPAAFAELSLIVTLMLVITLITATVQTVAAKFAAIHAADGDDQAVASLRSWLTGWAWIAGLGMALAIIVAAPWLAAFFQMRSVWPFVILVVGLPLYFAQGVDRGILQGQIRFTPLSFSYQAEMWVRLVVGISLVALGFGVNGAVAGLTLSFVGTWLVALQARQGLPKAMRLTAVQKRSILLFAWPVGMALIGQILINNSDILIVKRFFDPADAGQYAALALIGRIVFFATWSVVTALFPIVAQRHQRGEAHRHLLYLSLGLVLGVSVAIILAARFVPTLIVGLLFGDAYLEIAPLLWLYAVATAFYALSNVVITYRLSIGSSGGSYVAVVGGVAQVLGVWLFHGSLAQVVMVQLYVMGTMTLVLLLWDGWLAWRQRSHA
ncbi:MAG: oligosaccharide flippase family protein [Caldilineaceae bacterium]|nr:oligosaccharide flippase family protein [Caldilineaceae bacterium]MBP8107064.1 oligosaccharide flippase family protein [Caldilineaceae bacterium]MBP8121102.1 oligosaccharide flippase family protein [Caldilineaceae bacterium]MBP9070781.1 oligosaccharide flippase family protein [Caldilineaceae bacterium]